MVEVCMTFRSIPLLDRRRRHRTSRTFALLGHHSVEPFAKEQREAPLLPDLCHQYSEQLTITGTCSSP
ncbi:hypothetical protein NECAME_11280 [Necator americanus]|uniref:Uncharacterized protein n=1 Tax=Necator americanus TaxID=51031 RepID=W2T5A5_NECAM|nr:hypothetical protein NECAME_11280 [Necator americanus]ETN77098.1 hypothetical protein NECAME_11280 [Necator americanus]